MSTFAERCCSQTANPEWHAIDDDPNTLCANRGAKLSFTSYQAIMLAQGAKSMMTESHRIAYGDWISSTLDSTAFVGATSSSATPPEVIFMRWSASLDIFTVAESHSTDLNTVLPFHPRWGHIVDAMAARLSPFVALHWRQEAFAKGVPNFFQCAKWAEEQVETMDVRNIYFMTD